MTDEVYTGQEYPIDGIVFVRYTSSVSVASLPRQLCPADTATPLSAARTFPLKGEYLKGKPSVYHYPESVIPSAAEGSLVVFFSTTLPSRLRRATLPYTGRAYENPLRTVRLPCARGGGLGT